MITQKEFTSEKWRPVIGYEQIYSVSDFGRVRRETSRKLLKLCLAGYGYPTVHLYLNGHSVTAKVHQLVATAFLAARPTQYEVNHRDGDKANNRVSNLEYVSHGENMRHAAKLGLLKGRHFTPPPRHDKLRPEQVREIRTRIAQGASNGEIAEAYGVSKPQISAIRHFRKWKHL